MRAIHGVYLAVGAGGNSDLFSISVNVLSMDDAVPRTHTVEIIATGVTVFESGNNTKTVEIAVTEFTTPPAPTYTSPARRGWFGAVMEISHDISNLHATAIGWNGWLSVSDDLDGAVRRSGHQRVHAIHAPERPCHSSRTGPVTVETYVGWAGSVMSVIWDVVSRKDVVMYVRSPLPNTSALNRRVNGIDSDTLWETSET